MQEYKHIYECWRHMVRRIHVLSGTYDVPVSLAETHILVELDFNPNLTATELAAKLEMDRSTLSRCLGGMEQRALITSEVDSRDKRVKHLRLAALGKSALADIDRSGNRFMQELAENLSSTELNQFLTYVRELADELGASPGVLRDTDHVLRSQLRRLARVFGLFREQNVLSATHEYILCAIRELDADEGVEATKISLHLTIDISTLSRALKALEKRGYVTRRQHKADGRKQLIRLTARGRAQLGAVEEAVAERIRKALSARGKGAIRQFAQLFHTFAFGEGAPKSRTTGDTFTVQLVASEIERQAARAFLIEELFRAGRHTDISGELFTESGVGRVLVLNGQIQAASELKRRGSRWYLENFSARPNVPKEVIRDYVFSYVRQRGEGKSLQSIFLSEKSPLRKLFADSAEAVKGGYRITIT